MRSDSKILPRFETEEEHRKRTIEEKIAELERPHRDREVMSTLYWERGMSLDEVADEVGCRGSTASRWFDRLNIETRDRIEASRETTSGPWRNPDTLERKYIEEGKSLREVAADLGTNQATIRRNLLKNNIETRDQAEGARKAMFKNRAGYSVGSEGYPKWNAKGDDGSTVTVRVHQLLACLDNDPHRVFEEGTEVHHDVPHKLANLPGLLSVLSIPEHRHTHAADEWRMTEDGIPALVSQTDDGA